jgi:hypothetical protein
MKNLLLFVLVVLCISMAMAQENKENKEISNFDQLKSAHVIAMKYYGHANLLSEKDNQMIFLSIDKNFASVCYGKEIATAYMETETSKFYWFVQKTEKGIILSSKLNLKGVKYSRSVEVIMSEAEFIIRQRPDMDEGSRVSCSWSCLGSKFLGCVSCLKDWKCWLTCAGPGIWECCQW